MLRFDTVVLRVHATILCSEGDGCANLKASRVFGCCLLQLHLIHHARTGYETTSWYKQARGGLCGKISKRCRAALYRRIVCSQYKLEELAPIWSLSACHYSRSYNFLLMIQLVFSIFFPSYFFVSRFASIRLARVYSIVHLQC